MPTYEYSCRDCGQHLEVVQSFRDDPLTVCGSCSGSLRKVFSPAGVIFKGSGYYTTDTRAEREQAKNGSAKSGGPGSSGSSDSASSSGSGSSDSGSSDSGSSDSGSKSKSTDSGSESAA